ncbi:hypothetical protein [Mesorhizobium sp. M0898]
MLNVQLDRLDGIIEAMRVEKKTVLAGTRHLSNLGLTPSPMNSADDDCAAQVMYLLPSEQAAQTFSKTIPSVVAGKTGRHNFTQWDQVLMHEGAHHPALNPYALPENQGLRLDYSDDLGKRSLDILNRTVMVAMNPAHSDTDIQDMIHNIDAAARVALENASLDDIELRKAAPVDLQKFDSVN